MRLRGVNTRPLDGKLLISGDLMIFLLYVGEGENIPVQWMEESIPFSGEMELPESAEEMVPMVNVRLAHKELEAKPDYDGEMREFGADAVLDLDIRLYQEEDMTLLGDLYSTREELEPVVKTACFQQILAKNACKCKLSEKFGLNDSRQILQICRSDGTVKLDEVSVVEDGLLLEGILELSLLYLTSDDVSPIQSEQFAIPYQCSATAPGVTEESIYQVIPGLEQLTAVMLGGIPWRLKRWSIWKYWCKNPWSSRLLSAWRKGRLIWNDCRSFRGLSATSCSRRMICGGLPKNFTQPWTR